MSRKPLEFFFFPSLLPLTQSHSRKQDSGPCSLPAVWVMRPCFLCLSFATNEIGLIGFSQGFCGLAFIPAGGQPVSQNTTHTSSFHQQQWRVTGWSVGRGGGKGVYCTQNYMELVLLGDPGFRKCHTARPCSAHPAWALLSRNPRICQKVSEVCTPTALFWSTSPSLWGRQWAASKADTLCSALTVRHQY